MQYKPDILYFMTDPRFYEWLWDMEHEIRHAVPMIYYHVWDNVPYPRYNKGYYDSNDMIVTISKVTSDIVQNVSPGVEEKYIPHAVDPTFFKPAATPEELTKSKEMKHAIPDVENKMVFFWNNRNARRKQSGTLIYWFKTFLDRVGHDKAVLVMHTDIRDPHGQPLDYLLEQLGMNKGQVIFSVNKLPPEELSYFYKFADCTINISDAEGFGLATLESLASGTPIIVTMTGGLQEQVTDGENWFGIGIEPVSKSIIGSLSVPYIYEDRIGEEDFVDALEKIYNMSPEERKELGRLGREHVEKNYNFENFQQQWVDTMLQFHETNGSWETRKNYQSWECITL
jgi:glycosyltransferase involved in cell wall biosynthesis